MRAEFHGPTTSKAIRIFRTGSNNNNALSYSIGYHSNTYKKKYIYQSPALCTTLAPKKCFSSDDDDGVIYVYSAFFNRIGRNETVLLLKYTFYLLYLFFFFVITISDFSRFNLGPKGCLLL